MPARQSKFKIQCPTRCDGEHCAEERDLSARTLRVMDSVWSRAASSTSYRRQARMRYSGWCSYSKAYASRQRACLPPHQTGLTSRVCMSHGGGGDVRSKLMIVSSATLVYL